MSLTKEPKIVTEAKDYMRHEKAPALLKTPTLEGFLQVYYAGTKCTRGNILLGELQLRLVDRPSTFCQVLYKLGSKVVKTNTIITLDACPFTMTINNKLHKAYLQTYIAGQITNKFNVQMAEIGIRFADGPGANARILMDCGLSTLKAGQGVSIKDAKFKINLTRGQKWLN